MLPEILERLPTETLLAEQARVQERMSELNSKHDIIVTVLASRAIDAKLTEIPQV